MTEPSAVQAITFLRSTTTTRVDREADGDTKTRVEHVARFAVELGTLPDQLHQYGSQVFRPSWAVVVWANGVLTRVRITGPRVLKDGTLSEAGHASSREYEWTSWSTNRPLDRDKLPAPLASRLAEYESAVVEFVGKGTESGQ